MHNLKRMRKEEPLEVKKYGSMDEAYYPVYADVRDNGDVYNHREGRVCTEMRPYVFQLTDPTKALFTGSERRMNYRFWAAETLGYIAGWGLYRGKQYADLLVKLNSNYANFRDAYTGLLHKMVCYGDGFGPGLAKAYETLSKGPNRRQAIVYIGGPETRHTYEDNPCLATAQFFVEYDYIEDGKFASRVENNLPFGRREPKLSALFHIRSNDLNWGFPYDVASFCAIQIAMAGALGMAVGTYTHMATSLHYYHTGAAMGEGPPNITFYEDTEWIVKPPKIPWIDGADLNSGIDRIQKTASWLLEQMFEHFVIYDKPGRDFYSDIPDMWARRWTNVIKWGWPKQKALIGTEKDRALVPSQFRFSDSNNMEPGVGGG